MPWELWVVFGAPVVTLLFMAYLYFFTEPLEEDEE